MFPPSLTTLATLALLGLSMTQVNGQMTTAGPSPPMATAATLPSHSAFTDTSYIDGQVLYLGDGSHSGNANMFTFIGQFYALDLTTSWKTESPAWKSLNRFTEYPGDNNGPLAASPDGKSVYFFPYNGTRRYDVATNQYTKDSYVNIMESPSGGVVTDTDASQFYTFSSVSTTGAWNITAFDPVKNSYTYQTLSSGRSSTDRLTTVYSSAKKSLFSYRSPFITGVSQLNQYDIAAKTFTPITTTGAIPPQRVSPCFASAYGGSKLIIAGGAIDNNGAPPQPVNPNLALDDVYMLDVATMVWTKLATMPSKYYGGICAVSGDSFIIWGGYNTYSGDRMVIQSNLGGPIVLDLKANTWGTTYTPSSKGTTGGNSTGGTGGTGGGSGNGANGALNLSAKSSMAGFLAIVAVSMSMLI